MILSQEDVVTLSPNVFKYLRWTYQLVDSNLTDADFKLAYHRYSTTEDNIVVLKQNGFYSIYQAVDSDLSSIFDF